MLLGKELSSGTHRMACRPAVDSYKKKRFLCELIIDFHSYDCGILK